MLKSNSPKSFRPGDRVIFRIHRHGTRPRPGAKQVRPEPHGEGYLYLVDKRWVIAETRGVHVVVQTGQGRNHLLKATDARLQLAPWWQRLIFRSRFPKPRPVGLRDPMRI